MKRPYSRYVERRLREIARARDELTDNTVMVTLDAEMPNNVALVRLDNKVLVPAEAPAGR